MNKRKQLMITIIKYQIQTADTLKWHVHYLSSTHIDIDTHTHKQLTDTHTAERLTDRPTQTDRQTDRQTNRQTDQPTQTQRHTDRQTDQHRQTDK